MIQEQFIAAARKAAADIHIKYALVFRSDDLKANSEHFKVFILKTAKINKVSIFSGYQLFITNSKLDYDFIEPAICGFVDALNDEEKGKIINDANDIPIGDFPQGHDLNHK